MLSHYEVREAATLNDAFPSSVFHISAINEQIAAASWAKDFWPHRDYPKNMECIVTQVPTGDKWQVNILIEAEPVFYCSAQRI